MLFIVAIIICAVCTEAVKHGCHGYWVCSVWDTHWGSWVQLPWIPGMFSVRNVLKQKKQMSIKYCCFSHNKIGFLKSNHIRLLGQWRRYKWDVCVTAHYERFVASMFSVVMKIRIVIIIIILDQSNSFGILMFNLNNYNNYKLDKEHLALLWLSEWVYLGLMPVALQYKT